MGEQVVLFIVYLVVSIFAMAHGLRLQHEISQGVAKYKKIPVRVYVPRLVR